jgi:hypothetical protein
VTLRFADPQAAPPTLPGAIHSRGAGREWDYLCNGGLESLKQAAIQLGAEVIAESTVTLDEVFVGRVGSSAAKARPGDKEATNE